MNQPRSANSEAGRWPREIAHSIKTKGLLTGERVPSSPGFAGTKILMGPWRGLAPKGQTGDFAPRWSSERSLRLTEFYAGPSRLLVENDAERVSSAYFDYCLNDLEWPVLPVHAEEPARRTSGISPSTMREPISSVLSHLGLGLRATLSDVLDALANRPEPTEKEFLRLAHESPARLVSWIEDGTLQPAQLTFAAEALGEAQAFEQAVPCLLRLLSHPSSVVREGAIYGLASHMDNPGVRNRLMDVAKDDPREGVRKAASEALE